MFSTSGGPMLPDNVLFWLALILYFVVFMSFLMWMAAAQQDYLRLLRELTGVDGLRSVIAMLREQWWWLLLPPVAVTVALWRAIQIFWTPQGDPQLERARRRFVHRWWLSVAIGVGGGLAILALFSAGL